MTFAHHINYIELLICSALNRVISYLLKITVCVCVCARARARARVCVCVCAVLLL